MSNENDKTTEEQDAINAAQDMAQKDAALRDAEVAKMAAELGIDDFDPAAAGVEDKQPQGEPMSEQEQMAALMQDDAGSEFAAGEMINTFEMLLQQFGHHKFKIEPSKKEQTAKAVAPAIKKHGASLSGVLGDYKEEVFAALAFGSLAFGSIKEIKELKAIDKAKEVKPTEPANDGDAEQEPQKEAA